MKNYGTIIGIVLTVVMIVIVGVLTYHSMYSTSKAAEEKKMYQVPLLKESSSKPGTTFNKAVGEAGTQTEESTIVDDSPESLMDELNKTVDDEGAKELEDLKTEAGQL